MDQFMSPTLQTSGRFTYVIGAIESHLVSNSDAAKRLQTVIKDCNALMVGSLVYSSLDWLMEKGPTTEDAMNVYFGELYIQLTEAKGQEIRARMEQREASARFPDPPPPKGKDVKGKGKHKGTKGGSDNVKPEWTALPGFTELREAVAHFGGPSMSDHTLSVICFRSCDSPSRPGHRVAFSPPQFGFYP